MTYFLLALSMAAAAGMIAHRTKISGGFMVGAIFGASALSIGTDLAFMPAAIIVLGLGTTYWMMGRALRPLTVLSRTVCDINEHNLDKTIEGFAAKDEVGSITASFNGMLVRLKGAFEQQKRFAASAAHELKTPLATMKTSLL